MHKVFVGFVALYLAACTPTAPEDINVDEAFKGEIGKTIETSVPHWTEPVKAPEDAPSILIILLDDIGFADPSTFGGLAQTPNLDAMAASGVAFNNFNVTGMCSPTRASLLTGHNHHRVGFAGISEYANGFPGYDSYWKPSTASVAEVLRSSGYNTAAIGKWHNTPVWEISQAGPFDRWPTGLGFEYFYGFMGAEDNQWEPDRLYENTRPIDAPKSPEEGYHLTSDMADKAIEWMGRQRSVAPEKPFFMYFATGGTHSPHHAPEEWIALYRGAFDAGWDELREDIFARQKRLGVVPDDAILTPRPAKVPAWDTLSADQQRLYARQMEVYAAFVSYTDHHVGRVIEAANSFDENSLVFYVVGDNGAVGSTLPGYGGVTSLAEDLARLDDFGGPNIPFNQSQDGWGWMGNTPFKYWKTVASHFGALRTPMVVSWPGKIGETDVIRSQFAHVTDIVPTIYAAIGMAPPDTIAGVAQQPLDGVNLAPLLADADMSLDGRSQYFELLGNRSIYDDGWMASALNAGNSPTNSPDEWELYNVESDFTQARNLAKENPDKLRELIALFDREATANNVYPIGGAGFNRSRKPFTANNRSRFDFFPGAPRVAFDLLPSFNQSFSLEAQVNIPEEGASGVLASYGFRNKGFALYVQDDRLVFENRVGVASDVVISTQTLAPGEHTLMSQFTCSDCDEPRAFFESVSGALSLYIGDQLVAEQQLSEVNFANAGESFSFDIGRAAGSRISDAYEAPFAFSGQLERLSIILHEQ